MRYFLAAIFAAMLIPSLSTWASVPVEQIEAYTDSNNPPTQYAPVNFNGSALVTPATGAYAGIHLHALSGLTNTYSSHADTVASDFYGSASVGNPYVTDAYIAAADTFFNSLLTQSTPSANGPVPPHFAAGAKIINNSYVADYGSQGPDTDALRRLDFMINRDDVTFVAGAANNNSTLTWSSFNSLAVRGNQTFYPSQSYGKAHADLGMSGEASYNTATVSGYATGLYGHAQAANQSDALHGIVLRSLLMAGAGKSTYTRQTTNNLDTQWGAGQPSYSTSLSILQAGEKSLENVGVGSSLAGAPGWSSKGWTYETLPAGGQSAIIFHSDGGLTGLTASLNWNVDHPQPQANEIDTTDAGTIFPHIGLQLWPVVYFNNQYQLGANPTSGTGLQSNAANDNVQYLYYTGTLPAGDYAFVLTGDPALSPAVGLSYTITEPTPNQWKSNVGSSWNTSGNWYSGIPNAPAARANFLTGPIGLTTPGIITLDGNRTIGQMTLENTNGYTIASGTGGTLTINDTGDTNGVNPSITIVAGNHAINAPVSLANGLTIFTASATSLTIGNSISGAGTLTASGTGSLSIASTSSVAVPLTVNGNVTFAAHNSGGLLTQTVPSITVGSTGLLSLADLGSANHANRTVLVTNSLSFAGSTNQWQGQLDLAGNDLVVHTGNLADLTNQLKIGYNHSAGGYWNGQGIISSTAGSDPTYLTTLGIVQQNANGIFDGQSISAGDVLIKYTYYGDADLSGKVDGTDYSLIDVGFNSHGVKTGWANGDFNYDGKIDGSDYSLIDNAFNLQGFGGLASPMNLIASSVSQITSSVPEPGSLSLLGLATVFLLRRRTLAHTT